eukprot:scaffold122305_cov35-Tisochrysis_lutea.AAC.3
MRTYDQRVSHVVKDVGWRVLRRNGRVQPPNRSLHVVQVLEHMIDGNARVGGHWLQRLDHPCYIGPIPRCPSLSCDHASKQPDKHIRGARIPIASGVGQHPCGVHAPRGSRVASSPVVQDPSEPCLLG